VVIEKAVPAVADGLRTMAEVIQTGQATTAVGLKVLEIRGHMGHFGILVVVVTFYSEQNRIKRFVAGITYR
jgi:hypothetical protein